MDNNTKLIFPSKIIKLIYFTGLQATRLFNDTSLYSKVLAFIAGYIKIIAVAEEIVV